LPTQHLLIGRRQGSHEKEDMMYDDQPTDTRRRNRKLLGAVGLLAAGAVVGGILASNLTATAADNNSTTSSGTPSSSGSSGPEERTGGSSPVRSDEKALTGSDAEKTRAAALEAVPGGTVYRVETDADGATYEAHMTKSDGSLVTVKLDENFKVTAVEDGMGAGGHGPDDSRSSQSGNTA
jgi:hypothetical protein